MNLTEVVAALLLGVFVVKGPFVDDSNDQVLVVRSSDLHVELKSRSSQDDRIALSLVKAGSGLQLSVSTLNMSQLTTFETKFIAIYT